MSLNELIEWAKRNNVNFNAPIEVGDMSGSATLDSKMIDIDDRSSDARIYIEVDGNYNQK